MRHQFQIEGYSPRFPEEEAVLRKKESPLPHDKFKTRWGSVKV